MTPMLSPTGLTTAGGSATVGLPEPTVDGLFDLPLTRVGFDDRDCAQTCSPPWLHSTPFTETHGGLWNVRHSRSDR